ncbi:MAG: hypothetical protein ACR2HY_11050 [Acidimicrobiales bacterium]
MAFEAAGELGHCSHCGHSDLLVWPLPFGDDDEARVCHRCWEQVTYGNDK